MKTKNQRVALCFECNALADERHHVVPRSSGGTRTVPLCAQCHGVVHGTLIKAALAAKSRRGEVVGQVPYGFTAVDGMLVPNEREQALLATVRDLRSAGLSMRAVAAELELRGWTNRKGNPIAYSQVARMLKRDAKQPPKGELT